MSNVVSALKGKVAAGEVTVKDTGLRGMISLRGNLANRKLQKVCTSLTGAHFPSQGQAIAAGENALAWMSPDEVLIVIGYDAVPAALEKIAKAMSGQHHLATNVSDARAVIRIEGDFSRDVVAKLAPVDLHPDSFGVGDFRRTRLGQVAAAFWMRDDEMFEVICFRSMAQYAFDLLAASAKAGRVDHFAS